MTEHEKMCNECGDKHCSCKDCKGVMFIADCEGKCDYNEDKANCVSFQEWKKDGV